MLGLMAIAAGLCFLFVISQPAFGAYLLLFTTPLIAGIARGSVPLRPNEMLLLLVVVALGVRVILLMLSRRYSPPNFDRMDVALLLLILTSSALPVLWQLARSLPPSQDDLLYASVLIKYYILFRVFRSSIVTENQVMVCLCVSMVSATLEATIAILQVLNLFGIPEFLLIYYDQPFEGHLSVMTDRGTSTLASAFGHADLMIMNLIITLALYRTTRGHRGLLLAAIAVFLAGCVVCGEFSGYIGTVVALLAFELLFGANLRRILPSLVGLSALMVPFWPVLARRFGGFDGQEGVPSSWKGRWENLQHFFFPKLFSDMNWLLGVQPAPRLVAPEAWRGFVYIESGYVWLLWIGGLPLALAYTYFVCTSLTRLRRIAQTRVGPVAVSASAAYCYLVAMLVLMLFDPHLTLRGSADLLFPLLALSLVPAPAHKWQNPQWPQQLTKHQWHSLAAGSLPAMGGVIASTD